MAVLFPNVTLGVQSAAVQADAFGDYVPGDTNAIAPTVFRPGSARELSAGTWVLGVDPDLWPVHVNDVLVEQSTGAKWVARSVQFNRNEDEPSIDWVRVEANEVTTTGVEPGGPFEVGRR